MEHPPDLTDDDERVLREVWDELGRERGAVPPLCSVTDTKAPQLWLELIRGDRRAATKEWGEGMHAIMLRLYPGLRAELDTQLQVFLATKPMSIYDNRK